MFWILSTKKADSKLNLKLSIKHIHARLEVFYLISRVSSNCILLLRTTIDLL